MKRSSTIFLQVIIVLTGLAALTGLLVEPHFEGRNVNATFTDVYFKDPFLAYIYLLSVPFFIGLYQGFKLLGFAGKNKIFSSAAVKALQTIKYCAFITAAGIVAADIYIRIMANTTGDDAAGALALGMITIFLSIIIGATAGLFARVLQNAVNIKAENDLTV